MAENESRRKRGSKRGTNWPKKRRTRQRKELKDGWFVAKRGRRREKGPDAGPSSPGKTEAQVKTFRSSSRSSSTSGGSGKSHTGSTKRFSRRSESDGEQVYEITPRTSGSALPFETPPDAFDAPHGLIVQHYLRVRGFEIGDHIRDGGYSRVYEATYTSAKGRDTLKMACKVLDLASLLIDSKDYLEKNLRTELDFMVRTKYRYIVNTLKVFEPLEIMAGKRVYIFMERMDTDLETYVFRERGQPLDEEKARLLFQQVCRAVCFMHQRNYAHLDLKLENILLDETRSVAKLTDFGFTRYVYQISPTERVKTSDKVGTRGFTAPEIEKGIEYDPIQADIWSLGVTLFKSITKKIDPRNMRTAQQRREAAKSAGYSFTPADDHLLSDPLKQLVQWMLNVDPVRRPSVQQVLDHLWFSPSSQD